MSSIPKPKARSGEHTTHFFSFVHGYKKNVKFPHILRKRGLGYVKNPIGAADALCDGNSIFLAEPEFGRSGWVGGLGMYQVDNRRALARLFIAWRGF